MIRLLLKLFFSIFIPTPNSHMAGVCGPPSPIILFQLLAGLLGVESGQDAVIRTLLCNQAQELVHPYNYRVAEFTMHISDLRNRPAMCGIRDEGLIVPLKLGAENRTCSNILSANANSLLYSRTPAAILRSIYGTGDEHKPGGFFPKGANFFFLLNGLKMPCP